MKAIRKHPESFGIYYDQTQVQDVTPSRLVLLWGETPAAVVGETDTTYQLVTSDTTRVATIPEDDARWQHEGKLRAFDREYLIMLPTIIEVSKDLVSETKCWCDTGINWDTYYALNKEDLPSNPDSTDGRTEVRETELFGFKVWCERVHNVRW